MLTAAGIAVDGIAFGMVLFVISIGLSITLGLMRIVNLAHGVFAMTGGYVAATFLSTTGLTGTLVGYALAMVLAALAAVLLALPLERLLYRRLYGGAEPLAQVLLTIGVTFVAIGVLNALFGPSLKPIPLPPLLAGPVDLGFTTVPAHRLLVLACGGLTALGLWLLFDRTGFGVRLRAVVDDAGTAAALGVRTGRLYAAGFALAAGLAGLGGVLGAELLPIEPFYALRYMVTFLVVTAVGGAGSIAGALAASLLLGLIDTAGRYLFPELGTFFFFLAVILVVGLFPHGLFGRNPAL